MDVKAKTKDNQKTRMNVVELWVRRNLELVMKREFSKSKGKLRFNNQRCKINL